MNAATNASAAHGVSAARRWAIFLALALLALIIRLPQLRARPMHTDESVNAYVTGQLLAGEPYRYDPRDRHGPALFVFAEPATALLGARDFAGLTETELRLTPVLIGSATVLLFGAVVDLFGFTACFVAALLFAVAALPVYYSRYFIHETLFVASTLGLMAAGGRAWKNNSLVAAALAGGCGALMLGAKETAGLHFFALGLVCLAAVLLPPRGKVPAVRVFAVALGVLVLVAVLLFTWLGQNWQAVADLGTAIPRLAARAAGEGHEKPFAYYLHLLDPTLVLFIVAAAGIYAAVCDAAARAGKAPILLVIYGALIFLIYSAIPYKTPWLALNLWLPTALICGLGVAAFWHQIKDTASRWIVVIAGVFLLATLGVQTKVLVFDRPADERNPFAYAQTSDDLSGLPPRLEQLVAENHLSQPRIAVVAADPWPLPWYLRKFAAVGFWQPGQEPAPSDFFVTSTDLSDALKARLKDFRPEYFGVRPGVLVILWIPPSFKIASRASEP
jgi:uncharacterized protein (TIGR03663 family)